MPRPSPAPFTPFRRKMLCPPPCEGRVRLAQVGARFVLQCEQCLRETGQAVPTMASERP